MPSSLLRVPGAASVLLAACTSVPLPPAAPPALQPPADQRATEVLNARGVQIYECAASAGGGHAWTFKAPEAELTDPQGRASGTHFAGPTWQAADGSRLTGTLRARDPGPDPQAIPWLLLDATPAGAPGRFSGVRSIQRLQTIGGLAPARPCDAAHAGEQARVPYRAVYVFFAAAH